MKCVYWENDSGSSKRGQARHSQLYIQDLYIKLIVLTGGGNGFFIPMTNIIGLCNLDGIYWYP